MDYEQLIYAEALAEEIVDCYKKFGVFIAIKRKHIRVKNKRYIFPVKIKGNSRVADIKRNAYDVQKRLKLVYFHVEESDVSIQIVVSNNAKNYYTLLSVLRNTQYREKVKMLRLAHPVGVDSSGDIIVKDLALYPHVLITGATGSGKSGALQNLVLSLMIPYSPEKINFLICDMVGDLLGFQGLPHLSHPVIQEFEMFCCAMQQLYDEMERRIKLKGKRIYLKLPSIVCVVDEFTSFITGTDSHSKRVREIITEILRRGRHAKIHMVLATHNPSQRCLKLDLSDIPTKMVFRVARQCNSLTVLNQGGAEKLSGNGDMLFQSSQSGELQRIQGTYVSKEDLERMVPVIKSIWRQYNDQYKFCIAEKEILMMKFVNDNSQYDTLKDRICEKKTVDDKLLARVVVWTLGFNEISCNMLSENFGIGWRRANGFLKKLYEWGVVSELDAKLPRKVMFKNIEEMPSDLLSFLECNGYAIEMVSKSMERRQGIK